MAPAVTAGTCGGQRWQSRSRSRIPVKGEIECCSRRKEEEVERGCHRRRGGRERGEGGVNIHGAPVAVASGGVSSLACAAVRTAEELNLLTATRTN